MLVLKYLPEGIILASPSGPPDYEAIFALRWEILRKPWGLARGSEQDPSEYQAIHRMVFSEGKLPAIQACGRIQQVSESQAQVRYMAVAREMQGKGRGSIVLESLEEAAADAGLKEIFLNAREAAVGFYLRAGYEMSCETEPFLGIRHFRMNKLLSQ